jgi:RNA polymerase sigma factor (TIGR02999 family)
MSDPSRNALTPKTEHASPGDELLEKVYKELRQLAAARLAREEPQTLQPTALVHEAWIQLKSESAYWENTAHYFGAASQAMRRILIQRARQRSRLKRGGDQIRVDFENLDLAAATVDDKILMVDDALERLSAVDDFRAQIVELKFFGGLTNGEVANLLNISERTVDRHWKFARAWLYSAIEQEFGACASAMPDLFPK